MNVKLIKMWSGEDVIADLIKETDDSIVFQNPIVVVPSVQHGQASWSGGETHVSEGIPGRR